MEPSSPEARPRPLRDARLRRRVAGGSVSLLGVLLLGVPVFDIRDDLTDLSWPVTTTLAENVPFLLLAGVLVGGGMWILRNDWETEDVTKVAWRTIAATVAIAVLIGWVVSLQLWAMHSVKPYVIAADGVLVGAVTSFGLSVVSVRAEAYHREAQKANELNDRLEQLYRAASDLEGATTVAEAYDVIEASVTEALPSTSFRVVVDDEVVADHTGTGSPETAVATADIGSRGRIELFGESFSRYEVVTVELFAAYLDEALQRVERERRTREERDILEFVNRTLRHDLTGDIALVRARLRMLDRNASLGDDTHEEHLSVALDRVDEMDEFVGTMRTYMQAVLHGDHALTATALGPVVAEQVDAVREAHPDADVECGSLPEVTVEADDLLGRVFANLLTNAVDHNDASTPEVVVEAERIGDVVRIRIADNGPGISDQRRESIFEQGERATDSDGTGFGLYLVKDVVERYGGEVRVRDNEPRGTVFELDLPVTA